MRKEMGPDSHWVRCVRGTRGEAAWDMHHIHTERLQDALPYIRRVEVVILKACSNQGIASKGGGGAGNPITTPSEHKHPLKRDGEVSPRTPAIPNGSQHPYLCSVRISSTFSASQMFLAVTSPPGSTGGEKPCRPQCGSAARLVDHLHPCITPGWGASPACNTLPGPRLCVRGLKGGARLH